MTETPYLSIVATARNDNHGGNMLRRMQIFINGFLEQCQRHQLPAELIIVEWNPPTDRPRLAQALTWSVQDSPCAVRIIEVPNEVHRRFKYSEALPLFQMIAKNVGIRRARGQFVLATNIDLLFSDELCNFLASRQLQPGEMYRIDRYDAASDVPLEAPLEEQLRYCEQNLLRINRRYGTEELTAKAEELTAKAEAEEPTTEAVEQTEPLVFSNPHAEETIPDTTPLLLSQLRDAYRNLLPVAVRDAILRRLPKDTQEWLISRGLLNIKPGTPESVESVTPEPMIPEPVAPASVAPEPVHPPCLHTNACGDFTLMAKEDWLSLGGYAELEMYSFHIDSILCHAADLAGVRERVLDDPMRIYHIEHGGGWTPTTEELLDRHLKSQGIPKMTFEQLLAVISVMQLQRDGKQTFFNFFNDENWGLANETLPEIKLQPEKILR